MCGSAVAGTCHRSEEGPHFDGTALSSLSVVQLVLTGDAGRVLAFARPVGKKCPSQGGRGRPDKRKRPPCSQLGHFRDFSASSWGIARTSLRSNSDAYAPVYVQYIHSQTHFVAQSIYRSITL